MLIDLSKLEKLKIVGNGWSARCPACAANNDGDRSGQHLSILKNGKFNCVVGSDSDSSHNKTILSICGTSSISDYVRQDIEAKIEVERIYDEDVIGRLVKNYDYFNKRNIPNEVLEKFDCGLAGDGQLNNRFVFCCRNIENKIIGFAARSVKNSDMKWKIIGAKSKFIFPSKSMSYDVIKNSGKVILVESVPCCLSLAKVNLNNTICLFGTSISQSILQYLISLSPKSIIISTNLDSSNIGQEAAQKIYNKLLKFFNEDIVSIKFPFKKDFNDMDNLELEKWRAELNG